VGEALPGLDRVGPASIAAFGAIALGIADGGFFERSWAPAIVAFAAAVEVALLVYSSVELSRLEVAVLLLLGAFVAWSALSAGWSDDPTASLREAERSLLYLVALLAMLLATRRGDCWMLVFGVLLAATFVSLYGLIQYLAARPPTDPVEGTLLFEPLGYANAAGILAAIGIAISVGLVLDSTSFWDGLARALPLVVLVPTLALTDSKGSWAALAVALVVLIAVRFRLRRAHLALLVAALAIAGTLVIWSGGSGFWGERPSYWRVGWREYRDNPAVGSGAGTYVRFWGGTQSPTGRIALDAHNLYLETLAELGPVGLALLVGALALPLLAIRRGGAATVAGAAYVAFLVHAGIDWDWEMPAVTVAALGCAAALLVAQRQNQALVPVSPRVRALTAFSIAALAIAVLAVAILH
jgi:O-antigen ligase